MPKLTEIFNLLSNSAKTAETAALLPSFKDLMAMRRYVPYLLGFKFNKTGVNAGDARSSFKGRGMEFEEVRAYNISDDARDIDWRVTARKNQPFTKLFAEEKDREVYVWLDLSAAMRFGTRHELKSVTAAKTAALLGWFAIQNKDRFGLALFDGQKTRLYPAQRSQQNLMEILKQIENIAAQTLSQTTDTETPLKSLHLLQNKITHRAIIFIISGFEDFSAHFERALNQLSHANEVYLVNIFDRIEEVPPPQGQYLAQGNDGTVLLNNNGHRFEQKYQAYFAQKRQYLKNYSGRLKCQYREIRTDLPISSQLRPV